MNKKWETVFDVTKTTPSSKREPGREYQVALMLQDGNKGCMYVDGEIVGSSATITTPETLGHEITHFYFLGCEGDINSNLTVTNVFLYSRPLSVGELKMVKKTDDKKKEKMTAPCGGASLGCCCAAFWPFTEKSQRGLPATSGNICVWPRTLLNNCHFLWTLCFKRFILLCALLAVQGFFSMWKHALPLGTAPRGFCLFYSFLLCCVPPTITGFTQCSFSF
ncbi:trans-sialidase [Trypanosoma cruzi]|nr:trans-sialidase [Trypanosoma cruzi]